MRGDERQGGRRYAFNAPGLTQARRADREELLLDFVGEPGEARVVQVSRKNRRIIAAIAGDVLGLAVEINGVFRVGFKSRYKICGNIGKMRPDARKNSDRELGLRRKLEGRASSPVAIDDQAVRLKFARCGGRGLERRPRLIELALECSEGARPLGPDAAKLDRLSRSGAHRHCRP